MEGIGAEVSQKIRSAIKAKLMEIGVYVDEELPDYVMVMVANKRSKEQMDDDLQLFLGKHTSLFTTWLHQVLQKLQEVTVANLRGVKRKLSEDSKKKKKAKSDSEKKEPRKKIKIESEDDNEQDLEKITSKGKKDRSSAENDVIETVTIGEKERRDLKSAEEQVKEKKKNSSKNNRQLEENASNSQDLQNMEETQNTTSKSQTMSSEVEDLEDDDCINIRTDGELLDTTEEPAIEELKTNTRDEESPPLSKRKNSSDKKRTFDNLNPVRSKEKSKQTDNSKKIDSKKQNRISSSPPAIAVDKVIDARELLNRKKAAKKEAGSDKTRTKSRDRSESPVHKRKSDTRDSKGHHEERDKIRKSGHNSEREHTSRRNSRDDNKIRKSEQVRDLYVPKKRESRVYRNDFDWDNKKESSARKTGRDSSGEDWGSSRPSKVARLRGERKSDREIDSAGNKRDSEDSRRRGGMLSQVVPRAPEPEDNVDTPVPSVVKVTPRPRRPPSQQPSSTLIMKAISEANRSLANAPPRPDSTQQARRNPIFTRTLRQLERIPPEKIAVSISNPLAIQIENPKSKGTNDVKSKLPSGGELGGNRSPENDTVEVTSEPEHSVDNDNDSCPAEEWDNKEDESEQVQDVQEPVLEANTVEPSEEQMEEMSDPQFVVTLNGYDPDGLYSRDLGEDVDGDDWMKEAGDEEPVLTSTPNGGTSPRQHHSSPIVIMNTPSVNHSNLIEVELVKSKSNDRCKYWPACRLADKCTFYHPTKPCKVFPACKFGDACLYIHPQCKYNALCTRKDCVFSHTPAHTPMQPAALPKVKALYAASAPMPCKFYPNCANTNCQFPHPQRACRYGLYCTKKDCSFDHGKVPPVDKLKWIRAPTT